MSIYIDVIGGSLGNIFVLFNSPIIFLIIIFLICILIGFVAALAGVGGGVLFTPIMMAFTTINPDIVRATGLAIATMSSLMSARPYLGKGIANFNLALFSSLPYTIFAIIGSLIGLHITAVMGNFGKALIRLALGVLVLFIVILMITKGRRTEYPIPPEDKYDKLANAFELNSSYYEISLGRTVEYRVINTMWGLLCFMGIGLVSGMFGLGAGWAIVPVYNLLMYVPLKVATATSLVVIGIGDTAAMWVYINNGAMIPIFVIPCLLGCMIGAQIGSRLMPKLRAKVIRWFVILAMLLASARLIQQALPVIMGVM
ncbi:sulfite exporter TauE/SafE family protein [Vulcanisaeta distributa]|uniref:Probable membrane transporter protein n=1 Tax=Vulcanisaeta distributa (strain DSM 14429 / JCM 11212 / NBRC 100878 / IC-017) TaxID=572478 RepID=E1QPF7_VULDI|nr:sulfite exporter TauE/SafE family protein [Vulcanisaeta distributa]ADN51445.1 protein of unknown function DUF81 [Vulcanisaeta distributa DSM 14429]